VHAAAAGFLGSAPAALERAKRRPDARARATGRWGAFILAVEVLGATSTVLYGLNIILTPVHEPLVDDPANPGLTKVLPPARARRWNTPERAPTDLAASIVRCVRRRLGEGEPAGQAWRVAGKVGAAAAARCALGRRARRARPPGVQVGYSYHVRVLVPCYKEDLEIVAKTIQAAYNARLPDNCTRTIYLCDDGKDKRKRKWCAAAPERACVPLRIVCEQAEPLTAMEQSSPEPAALRLLPPLRRPRRRRPAAAGLCAWAARACRPARGPADCTARRSPTRTRFWAARAPCGCARGHPARPASNP